MSHSEAGCPTDCSSPKIQHLACDSLLEQDKERLDDGWLFNVETEEPACDPENSNIGWEFLATSPLSLASTTESPHPGAQHTRLSENPSESRGSLLQFDRKAPGRISTSPTLRRLRASGLGTPHSLAQQNALEVSTLGSWRDPTGSSHCLSKNLSGSPEDSSHSMPSLRPHSRLSLDNRRAFDTDEAVGSRGRTPDEDTLLVLQATSERSLRQASPPGPQGPTSLSSTPGSREPQGEESHQSRFYEPRRSSVVVNLPGFEVFPGDLLVSDEAADYLCHPLLLLNPESKKTRWPFSKREMSKGKHKSMSDLESCLASVRITDFAGYEFCSLKDKTWRELMEEHQKVTTDQLDFRKQQEAMWELFTSECTYFLDHLLVLKMIFMNTLRYLQIHEYLLDVDLWRLFSNLEELTQTSLGFVNSLFGIIKDYVTASETSPLSDFISVLTQYFGGSLCQSHQTYCLNYSAALFYLESLKQREDFNIYLKWCERNEHCRRLRLAELLVEPLHRLTRYPLLLKNIWKRSTDSMEKISLDSIKEKVEKSIWELEGKVKWLDNFQKLRHLQEIIVWPPLWDRDKRFFIPEGLKHIFKEHMAENILSPTNRHLLYEGRLTLAESTIFLDVYLFLFDDFLLVTKTKHNKKKPGGSDTSLMCPSLTPELQTLIKEIGSCVVLDQPIPLDRLVVRSIDALHMSVFGLKNTFLIQHENRYRQCIAAFLLQARTENIKKTWMAQITAAITGFTKSQETKQASLFTLSTESSEI
uniref:pleckstrin homology domain-containing family G member 7 n=1 Tax=Jaculus jaculus TaxID=51337 RepID=UPI001E1B2A9B|nr:pleckstrin homology domain-containing family G member 7 [Jaculus jaculus]